MKSVRVEPLRSPFAEALLIDIVCDCGLNNLMDTASGERSVRHRISPYVGSGVLFLRCNCGRKYQVVPQTGHVHVFSLGRK